MQLQFQHANYYPFLEKAMMEVHPSFPSLSPLWHSLFLPFSPQSHIWIPWSPLFASVHLLHQPNQAASSSCHPFGHYQPNKKGTTELSVYHHHHHHQPKQQEKHLFWNQFSFNDFSTKNIEIVGRAQALWKILEGFKHQSAFPMPTVLWKKETEGNKGENLPTPHQKMLQLNIQVNTQSSLPTKSFQPVSLLHKKEFLSLRILLSLKIGSLWLHVPCDMKNGIIRNDHMIQQHRVTDTSYSGFCWPKRRVGDTSWHITQAASITDAHVCTISTKTIRDKNCD